MTEQLIIFDCDGVLVDSEYLENQLLVDMAARHGLRVNAKNAHENFVGRKLADCVGLMEEWTEQDLPKTFISDYREALRLVVETELKPVQGIQAALERIDILKCVASNGPRAKIEQALKVTNLRAFFEDRLFSAYDVNAWKPEPDLFLHAAAEMGRRPEMCTVVEDSRLGIEAALAAGMRVVAYAPLGHRFPGAITIQRMDDLPAALLGGAMV